MTKPFDLVVHGATGFTGRLVVEYLLQRYPAGSGCVGGTDHHKPFALGAAGRTAALSCEGVVCSRGNGGRPCR